MSRPASFDPSTIMERYNFKAVCSGKTPRFTPWKKNYTPGNSKENQQKSNFGDKKEPTDRTREILRFVYPINKSGTKQLVLGADPSIGFQPSLTIRKPGSPGIKLNGIALERFLKSFSEIEAYFVTGELEDMELILSAGKSLKFSKQYNGRTTLLKSHCPDQDKEYSMVLNICTWNFLKTLKNLLDYIYEQLKGYAPELQKMFLAMKNYLASKINVNEPIKHDEVEKIIFGLSGEDFEMTPAPDSNLDYARTFFEMKRYCYYDIAAATYNMTK